MNGPDARPSTVEETDPQVSKIEAAKALFPLEGLQHLNALAAARCQSMLGNGAQYGIWETPEDLIEVMAEGRRRVDLRRRLKSYLPKALPVSADLDAMLDEGVLYLTRLGLLMRMGPVGLGNTAKGKALDVTTLARLLHQPCARVVAKGIERRMLIGSETCSGFAQALTAGDLKELAMRVPERIEVRRLRVLHDRGLWPDAPAEQAFKGETTAVRGDPLQRPAERRSTPFSPLPDDYMAEMGQRVLWLIRDLGPNLIHLLKALPGLIGDQKFATTSPIRARIVRYFEQHDWRDRHGELITELPFTLRHNTKGSESKDTSRNDECIWPPQTWSSVQSLAATLQRAHLWLALLIMAPRQGEVLALKRDCVAEARDGKVYVAGKTYKPTRQIEGKEKESPPPDVLVFALAQQVQLVLACEKLAKMVDLNDELVEFAIPGTHLWAALGSGAKAEHTKRLRHAAESMVYLAKTLGLNPKPGGKNIHPHRMRKTLARIAGIAIDGAQKVLMRLLGHENVTTTLLYMQSDPAFAKEIDDVAREIRILRAEGLIKDMHAALHDPGSLPFAGHGGGGASVLSDAVRAQEEALHRMGKEWGADTARELAILLTNNGESARLIAPHVVCTKTAGEVGMCSQKRGGIVPGNCQVECHNHIEEASGRRDVERIIPILTEHAVQNIAEGNWLPAQNNKRQLIRELSRYDDIGKSFRASPSVQQVLGWGE